MKEYGFNTTLLHGSEDSNPYGATQVPIYSPVHSVMIRQRNWRRFLPINVQDILTQESIILRSNLLRSG